MGSTPSNRNQSGKKRTATRRPLPEVAEFIEFVHSRRLKGRTGSLNGIWFSHHDEGTLFLDPEESSKYSGLITALMKKHVPREDLSRRSVESFLQQALFLCLDLRSRNPASFEDRLQLALARLAKVLSAPPEAYRCWLPVEGLRLDTPRAKFGGVAFVAFGRHQVRQITLKRPATKFGRGKSWEHVRGLVRGSQTWGRVCAVVDVAARDSSSAETLALRRTRQILDVLNMFSDLVPYNHGWLYLPGETAQSQQMVAVQRHDGEFTPTFESLEPLADVSWKSLKATRHIAHPLRRLTSIAGRGTTSGTCADLLFTAAQWTGRATVDRRREQSFLLYAIALETMMLPTKETQGLGFRLRLRVAHLLGRSVADRERITQQVTDLYDVRSKVVHAGSYEVTDEELGRLRWVVKNCLFRLLQMPKVHAMNRKEFSAWLDRKLLR